MANKLIFEVGLDGAGFTRGIEHISKQGMESLRGLALSAFGIYSVEQAFHKTVESAAELIHTAKNLDMTIEQLQVLRQAAENNGNSFDNMRLALERFNSVRENILNKGIGWQRELEAMQRLGVTPAMLKSETAATLVMGPLADTAKKSNAADIAHDLQTVFSRNGMEMFRVLKVNFEDLQKSMENIGAIMDTKTAVTLEVLDNELILIGKVLVNQTAPAIIMFAEVVMRAIGLIRGAGSFWGNAVGNAGGFGKYISAEMASSSAAVMLFLRKSLNTEGKFNANERAANAADQAAIDRWHRINDMATEAMHLSDSDWTKTVANIRKEITEQSEALDHPQPPNTDRNVPVPDEKAKKVKLENPPHPESDSLVRTGNFLGTAKGQIEMLTQEGNRIAREHVGVSRQILQTLRRPVPTPPGDNHYPVH